MDHGALDIVEVGVVLQRALQQAGLLAEGGNVRTVVVREHLVAHDRVGHLNIPKTILRFFFFCGQEKRFYSYNNTNLILFIKLETQDKSYLLNFVEKGIVHITV